MILIAAAALFAAGMKSIGLTGALVDAMRGSQSVAMISAAVGPFLMAVVSGSGNAAALAFNEAITPHAADFGMTIVQLGAVAQIAAGIGRTIEERLKSELFVRTTIGIGTISEHLRELADSYKEAQVAIEVGKVIDTEKAVIKYENLGISRLI